MTAILSGAAQAAHEASLRGHPPAKKCIQCGTKTRHKNRHDRPFCACCIVSLKRQDPKDARWMPGKLKLLEIDYGAL